MIQSWDRLLKYNNFKLCIYSVTTDANTKASFKPTCNTVLWASHS